MWNGSFGGNLLPYAATLATYYDALQERSLIYLKKICPD